MTAPLITQWPGLAQYIRLRESDDPVSASELDELLGGVGRNEAPAVLFELDCHGYVDDDVLAAILPGVWSGVEWPTAALEQDTWLEWFRDRCGYRWPATTLTVYRGAHPRHARGMSWTTDLEQARWFADRWHRMTGLPAYVYRFEAPPQAVLADIDALERDGRGEHEIVIDPDYLTELPERIESATQSETPPLGDVPTTQGDYHHG